MCIWLDWDGGGERYRMGGYKPPPTPTLTVLWSEQSRGSLQLEVLNQAVGLRGKSCLSVWNFIIFNYLDHALLPSLFLLFTLSRKHRLSSHSLVCLSACCSASFPFPVLPHPCLSHQLTFLTSATFPPVLSSPLCPIFLFHIRQ